MAQNHHQRPVLETAPAEIISLLVETGDHQTIRIGVIGGLARWHHIGGQWDRTQSIDMFVDNGMSEHVEQLLLRHHKDRFTECIGGGLMFKMSADAEPVFVWFVDRCPYPPAAAVALRDIAPGFVPYADPQDLILYKLQLCGLPGNKDTKEKYAKEASILLGEFATEEAPFTLTDIEKKHTCMGDVRQADKLLGESKKRGTEWWTKRLSGLL